MTVMRLGRVHLLVGDVEAAHRHLDRRPDGQERLVHPAGILRVIPDLSHLIDTRSLSAKPLLRLPTP